MAVTVFVWLTGQHDNIGDSILRREYARALRSIGPIRAWAGDPRAGYVTGLGLTTSEISHSFASWYVAFARAAIAGRGVFAFNAGEFVVTKGYLAGTLLLLPFVVISRLRTGRLVWLGASVRKVIPGLGWPFRAIAAMATDLRWRDSRSADILGRHAEMMPDWAFAVEGETVESAERKEPYNPGHRDVLAVSLRGDRPPADERWLATVEETASRLDLRLVVVVQVKRDSERAAQLADRWDCDIVDWRTDEHREQELIVRSIYRQSLIVLSDRLHALIVASTEGALPLGWLDGPAPKIAQHFEALRLEGVAREGDASIRSLSALDYEEVEHCRTGLSEALAHARQELASALTTPDSAERVRC